MKKFTVVDWQSFSLKKDIEKITKKLTDSNIIQSALLGELAIAVLAVGLNNIGVEKKCLFWVIVVVSILPLVLIFVRWCCEKHRERRPGSDRMDPRDFIDSFDNQIEYYTFMSESYYTMLLESLSGADSGVNDIDKNMLLFYYIQSSYYFNKAIYGLVPINNIVTRVLTSDKKEVIEGKLIALPRYNNVKNVLFLIFECLEKYKSLITSDDFDGTLIVETNQEFKKKLEIIDGIVKKSMNSK